MKIVIIALLIILPSCVHYKVNRIGRHEQRVEVSSVYGDKNRLIKYSRRKVKLLKECNWYEFIEKTENKVVLICQTLRPYRKSLYDK